jgi:protein required for attachment to host cells
MKPIVTWVLVSDLASARILEHTEYQDELIQKKGRVYKASNEKSYSDDEGRAVGGNTLSRVRLDRHVEYTSESETFARELLDVLVAGAHKKSFDRLIVSAGPSMLGLLRQRMPDVLKPYVRNEIAKDLVNMSNADVHSYLADII